ncbi:MAG: pyridoxine 5'-phosphate synthase [Deltaproteobacteria bacterium]|nr:pyridoxine 5'-phosphate synthase [Deltaproteobacteria bacterium]
MRVALQVNVDHVATLRQARGVDYPDPVHAAVLCELAGADGITVHLREDRRHIVDRDVRVLRETVKSVLNLEMAATDEMKGIALEVKPDLVTLVPEKREERTTEGGLDVVGARARLQGMVAELGEAGIPVSMFIDPDAAQIDASVEVGARVIELHTGDYANASDPRAELEKLMAAAAHAAERHPTLRVAAGHGLTLLNVGDLVRLVPEIVELNIGHALVADAVFRGMEASVAAYRHAIDDGESRR